MVSLSSFPQNKNEKTPKNIPQAYYRIFTVFPIPLKFEKGYLDGGEGDEVNWWFGIKKHKENFQFL